MPSFSSSSRSVAPNMLSALFRDEHGAALLAMMLASGGDERIALDAAGRNLYGAPIRPAADEAWFSSSSATAISPRGWDAAAAALPLAFSAARADDWHEGLRARLLAALAPQGSEVIFCASGTQAEYAALAIARALDGARPRPIYNLVVGGEETGRGAPLAASGRHFLDSAPFGAVVRGGALQGFSEVTLGMLPVRDFSGAPLAPGKIDEVGEFLARHALDRGARALLHVLDCSKTGRSGFSRALAKRLQEDFPHRATVVVDACQLRCAPETIRADLEAGFLVMISGSKFFGGPAFSGALLLPPQIVRTLSRRKAVAWPQGLAPHAALLDWPAVLRDKIAGPFGARANPGLGLRWEAALAEFWLYLSQPAGMIARAQTLFGEEARKHLACAPRLQAEAGAPCPTILPIVSRDGAGAPLKAEPILRDLRARGFHLGQKVDIAEGEALRLCLAAPQINDFCLRLGAGQDEISAFAPIASDMKRLFGAWRRLVEI